MTARDSTHESLARSLAPLALDGGDFSKFGGLSQLYVLEDIAQNYEQASSGGENSVKIHELFDIIVGAGTGSLVACLVGPLNLTPTDAISVYLRIHKAVFPSPDTNPPPSKEERALNLREILATVIEDCLGQEGLALNIKDLHYHHYTALTALPTVNLSSPVVFRTYDGRNGRVPAGTLLDILCATLSQPDFFPPISMGTPPEYFNSAMGIHLNPMDTVYAELCAQFSTSTLTAITSIGTGRPLPKALVVPTIGTRHTVFYDPFNSCHSTSQRFETRFSGHLNVYFRIDPDGYDPSAVSSPGTVTSHMRTFLSMQEHRLKLDQLVDTLEARNPNMAVSELISRPQTIDPIVSPVLDRNLVIPLGSNFTGVSPSDIPSLGLPERKYTPSGHFVSPLPNSDSTDPRIIPRCPWPISGRLTESEALDVTILHLPLWDTSTSHFERSPDSIHTTQLVSPYKHGVDHRGDLQTTEADMSGSPLERLRAASSTAISSRQKQSRLPRPKNRDKRRGTRDNLTLSDKSSSTFTTLSSYPLNGDYPQSRTSGNRPTSYCHCCRQHSRECTSDRDVQISEQVAFTIIAIVLIFAACAFKCILMIHTH